MLINKLDKKIKKQQEFSCYFLDSSVLYISKKNRSLLKGMKNMKKIVAGIALLMMIVIFGYNQVYAAENIIDEQNESQLIKIKEENKRNFYLKETISSKWSVRELQRQKNSLLYERLLLSKNKEKVLELAEKGQVIKTGKDLVKDPFVLEFLGIKENTEYLESNLEKIYQNI